jgi:hypothetical protein
MTTLEKLQKVYTDAVKSGEQAEICLLARLMGALQAMAECPGTVYDMPTLDAVADIAMACAKKFPSAPNNPA